MSIFEKITKSTEQIRETIENNKDFGAESLVESIDTFYSNTVVPKMKTSEYLKSANGWVYGCVGVIADEVAGIELKMLKLQKGQLTEVDEHEALDVLYRANNAMTRFDLINLTFQYLELTGEAPWFISFVNGKPDQIILLRPDRLTVKPGKNGELIGGYKYKVYGDGGFKEIDLEPFEIVHLKYADPDQPLRGKGPLQAAATTYDLDNYAERWNSQFFRNSASPSAALQTDKVLAKEVRQRLEKKLKENYEGVNNAHKTMVLENGLKWQSMSLTQKDMDFIEQQRFSRDKILAIFRVPRTALGITDDVNRANAEATDYVFAKRTIKPKMIRFVEQLNEFFLPLFGNSDNLYFDFEDPVPQNTDQLIKKAESGVGSGYMTINEAREIMGLDPIEGGDELREPSTFLPVINPDTNASLKGKKRNSNPARRYHKHLYAKRTRKAKAEEKTKEIYKTVIEDTVVPIVYSFLKKKYKKAVRKTFKNKDEKYEFQDKQLNVATEYEGKVVSKLNTIFDKQKDIINRYLDSGEKKTLKVSTETERTLNALKPTMMNMMKEQSDLAFQIVGVAHPFNDEAKAKKPLTFLQRLNQFFEIRTFRFATEVTKETNVKLQELFKEAAEQEESIPEIKKRVAVLFEGMKAARSLKIARTETILASNFSTEEAYKESGVVEGKEWLATRDERTDDECAALDGKVVSLNGKFFKEDYFDGKYPPLHANCRCTIIPVIKR